MLAARRHGTLVSYDLNLVQAMDRRGLEILDRVGGGDSFASGLVFGRLTGADLSRAVELGAAHGALAMTTPGDTSSATLAEVEPSYAGQVFECSASPVQQGVAARS